MKIRNAIVAILAVSGIGATTGQTRAQYGAFRPGYTYSSNETAAHSRASYYRPGFGQIRAAQSYRNAQTNVYVPGRYSYTPAPSLSPGYAPQYDAGYGNTPYQVAPQPPRNPQTDATMYEFLRPWYRQYLGREPDMPGVQGWVGVYEQVGGDTNRLQQLFVQAAQAEINSRNGVYQPGYR
jgi:hypothetical protein